MGLELGEIAISLGGLDGSRNMLSSVRSMCIVDLRMAACILPGCLPGFGSFRFYTFLELVRVYLAAAWPQGPSREKRAAERLGDGGLPC